MKRAKANGRTNGNKRTGVKLGFEETLWATADKMRGQMDAAEYKHIILGLIFLKYISDLFDELHAALKPQGADKAENPDEYLKRNVFWVPSKARWSFLRENSHQANIGKLIDAAMSAIEKENASLKGILPKNYSQTSLDNQRLSQLLELISSIGLGDEESRSKDILGRVYEYFLGRFAGVEGKGGEFYTPPSVVRLLVELVEPYKGSVYDPCCGSGGMFVQSNKFVQAHGGRQTDIKILGQESNPNTWRLCKMNLAIRGISGDIGFQHADTFHNDLHPQLKADFILANPPFNMSDWGGERLEQDTRWQHGRPPAGSANFAWVQHILHHLSPAGTAGFVLSNGSLSAHQAGPEGEIRKALIEADLVDCIVALPSQLFYTTQIASCLWLLRRKKHGASYHDRRGQLLLIYAAQLGQMTGRTHRELSEADISYVAETYHRWRNKQDGHEYRDVPGFSKSATMDEVRFHKWALVPGRYVGFDERLYSRWDEAHLRNEIEELTLRVSQSDMASKRAIAILNEVIHG